MQTWLIINLRIPGFHQWTDAPTKYAYLREMHRHEFHIKVELLVPKNRHLEFIDIKEYTYSWVLSTLSPDEYTVYGDIGGFMRHSIVLGRRIKKESVEGLAEYIGNHLKETYKVSQIKVTVMEDGENGAMVCLGET